jgi:hypothetical protein
VARPHRLVPQAGVDFTKASKHEQPELFQAFQQLSAVTSCMAILSMLVSLNAR